MASGAHNPDHFIAEHLATRGTPQVPHPMTAASITTSPFSFDHSVVQIEATSQPVNPIQPWVNGKCAGGRGSGWVTTMVVNGAKEMVVVTNHHVVNGAIPGGIDALLPASGRAKMRMHVLVDSPKDDLAILGFADNVAGLVALPMADSDRLAPGTDIVAAGYPLGQPGFKLVKGEVSGVDTPGAGNAMLQISAPICPGNSGGPSLVMSADEHGVAKATVIGVNTAIIQGAAGVGYAVPASRVQAVMDDYAYVQRTAGPSAASAAVGAGAATTPGTVRLATPILGACIQPVQSAALKKYRNIDAKAGGAYLGYVMPGSLMHKAGLRGGMTIHQIGADPVDDLAQVRPAWSTNPVHVVRVLNRLRRGDTLAIKAYDGTGVSRDYALKYVDCDPRAVKPVVAPYDAFDYENVGCTVAQLTTNHVALFAQQNPTLMARCTPAMIDKPALVVSHVFPSSAAHRQQCVMPGQLLTHVNGEPVATMQQFRQAVAKHGHDPNAQVVFRVGLCDFAMDADALVREHIAMANTHGFKAASWVKNLHGGAAAAGGGAPAVAAVPGVVAAAPAARTTNIASRVRAVFDKTVRRTTTPASCTCDMASTDLLPDPCGFCVRQRARRTRSKRARARLPVPALAPAAVTTVAGTAEHDAAKAMLGLGHLTDEEFAASQTATQVAESVLSDALKSMTMDAKADGWQEVACGDKKHGSDGESESD